jgi:hypothetical protein
MNSFLQRCINAKLLEPPMSKKPPNIAFLAYALGIEFRAVGETAQYSPEPDLELVKTLLRLGCNPNAVYKGKRTLWN